MSKPTVLITGVAGLLGSRLADYLIENDIATVIGIDDLSGGYHENINKDVVFYNIKLNSAPPAVDQVFSTHRPDYVYHFAAYAAEGLSPFIRVYNYQNNLISTTVVVNNCIKYEVRRLVFASSMAVYGNNKAPFSEDLQPAPIDPYGVAKYACEMDIQTAGRQHGLDWCIIRPHNVYGIKQNIWDKYRNVLGIWMYQHLNGHPMTIFGDGKQKRAFSYIDDSVASLWKAAIEPKASKEIINLGGIHETTINEAAATLIKIIGEGEVQHLEGRHEVKYAWSTYQKSIDILGFEHRTDLETGLTEMWNWAKTKPMKTRMVWDAYEIENGLYDFWKK
jgi:UDP-glucose 4-epimerase